MSLHPKVTPQAQARLVGKKADELVTLRLRTVSPMTAEQISLLTAWGGTLLYDNGIMAVLTLPARRAAEVFRWDVMLEVA